LTYFLQRYKYFPITTTIYKKTMDIDEIIYILKRNTINNDGGDVELGEQEAAATDTGASAGGAYPTVTKWESGLTRSVANQIDPNSKWKDLYKITRGKGNTLL
jgi:hypothetical protein